MCFSLILYPKISNELFLKSFMNIARQVLAPPPRANKTRPQSRNRSLTTKQTRSQPVSRGSRKHDKDVSYFPSSHVGFNPGELEILMRSDNLSDDAEPDESDLSRLELAKASKFSRIKGESKPVHEEPKRHRIMDVNEDEDLLSSRQPRQLDTNFEDLDDDDWHSRQYFIYEENEDVTPTEIKEVIFDELVYRRNLAGPKPTEDHVGLFNGTIMNDSITDVKIGKGRKRLLKCVHEVKGALDSGIIWQEPEKAMKERIDQSCSAARFRKFMARRGMDVPEFLIPSGPYRSRRKRPSLFEQVNCK